MGAGEFLENVCLLAGLAFSGKIGIASDHVTFLAGMVPVAVRTHLARVMTTRVFTCTCIRSFRLVVVNDLPHYENAWLGN